MTRDETPRDPLREAGRTLRVSIETIVGYVVADVQEADRQDDHDVDAEAVGNIVYEVLRQHTRAALASSTPDALDVETVVAPLDIQALYNALYRAWPRTFGNRLSWAQPSPEMAAGIATEYAAILAARGQQ